MVEVEKEWAPKEWASRGVAGAGLGLGIAGVGLNLLQNGITVLKSCRELKRFLQKSWRWKYDCEISGRTIETERTACK